MGNNSFLLLGWNSLCVFSGRHCVTHDIYRSSNIVKGHMCFVGYQVLRQENQRVIDVFSFLINICMYIPAFSLL